MRDRAARLIDADVLLCVALDSPILLAVPAVVMMSLLLGAAMIAVREVSPPRAVLAASASAGVVVHGGPGLTRLLLPLLGQPLRPLTATVQE